MEQNYVTVTLIYKFALSLNPIKHCALMEFRFAMTHILFTKFFWYMSLLQSMIITNITMNDFKITQRNVITESYGNRCLRTLPSRCSCSCRGQTSPRFGAVVWWISLSIRHSVKSVLPLASRFEYTRLASLAYSWSLRSNMTSYTKPEVHNVSLFAELSPWTFRRGSESGSSRSSTLASANQACRSRPLGTRDWARDWEAVNKDNWSAWSQGTRWRTDGRTDRQTVWSPTTG